MPQGLVDAVSGDRVPHADPFLGNTADLTCMYVPWPPKQGTVDMGMKFLVPFKSATIKGTDLFDLDKFGCRGTSRDDSFALTQQLLRSFGKKFWRHPSLSFAIPLGRIRLDLRDETNGEVRWDAVYDLKGGKVLDGWAPPLGGGNPYFQPDWCPAPADFLAHRYHLRVHNLSTVRAPQTEDLGQMIFIQYGPSATRTQS